METTVKSKQALPKVRLFISLGETPDDRAAMNLLEGYLNDKLRITRVAAAKGEVLPQVWEAGVCYSGLDEIRHYARSFKKTLTAA